MQRITNTSDSDPVITFTMLPSGQVSMVKHPSFGSEKELYQSKSHAASKQIGIYIMFFVQILPCIYLILFYNPYIFYLLFSNSRNQAFYQKCHNKGTYIRAAVSYT